MSDVSPGEHSATQGLPHWLAQEDLQRLLDALAQRGFTVVGPTVQASAIVYDRIRTVDQLPQGWTEEQEAGRYRLVPRADRRRFGFTVGPHSWKQFLFPPRAVVAVAERSGEEWEVSPPETETPRFAFLGVRACELAAIAVQDRVFLEQGYVDPLYAARRREAFLIAVNCTQAAPTCFCSSMHTGPRCQAGYDLALTELDLGFIVEVGSSRGSEVLASLPTRSATAEELAEAGKEQQKAVEQQVRHMDPQGLRETLLENLEHPRWEEVATRCLSCTNCTQVCPTCFCSSVQEVADLDVTRVERTRVWDSCFNLDFSYMNGGIVRSSTRSRYRQWLTHKLATWIDQFDVSGCVGCGRCITWCPVEIDLTEEVAAIRGEPSRGNAP